MSGETKAFYGDDPDMEENKTKIRGFLSRFFKNRDIRDDEDIFESGIVNSLLAMQLVLFVESEFGVAVEDEDLDLENFKSVGAISEFIERKSGVSGAV